MQGGEKSLTTLANVSPILFRYGDSLSLRQRVGFLPAADALVFVPPNGDKLQFQRVSVNELIKSIPPDKVIWTSAPSPTVEAGSVA